MRRLYWLLFTRYLTLCSANLRRNLYRGGIAEETLAASPPYLLIQTLFIDWMLIYIHQILIKDDTPTNENGGTTIYSTVDDTSDGGALLPQQSATNSQAAAGQDYTFGRNSNYTPRSDLRPKETNGFQTQSQMNDDFTYMPDGTDGFYDGGSGNNDPQPRFQRQQYDKFAKRTILLVNLPEGVTHADVVDVVRGGMLLDIYLRTHDRTASVSFLEEAAAHDFFRHVKRHDLYIRGKRVCSNYAVSYQFLC